MRLAGEVHAELFENARIDLGEDHRGVYFKSLQVFELVDCRLGAGICHTGDGERDQQLVQVQKRSIVASEMVDLHLHDRVDDLRADQLDAVLNARKLFEGVEKQRRGGAQTTGLSDTSMPDFFMRSSILRIGSSSAFPLRCSHRAS